jgi:transcriptional regulator with PAS, ATPase and Fis domain
MENLETTSLASAIDAIDAAVTVCDADLKILYMNGKSAASFESSGGAALVGKNLADCHKGVSVQKMKDILASGIPNVYTISKNGTRKLIWQGRWEKEGKVAGLIEISMPLPESMPHYDRG